MTRAAVSPELERLVGDWLRAEAPARAPGLILDGALADIASIPQERSLADRLPWAPPSLSFQARFALAAGLVVLALLGTILLVGAPAPRTSAPPRAVYEAVFLRFEPVGGDASNILVVSVAGDGTERLLARLPPMTHDDPEYPEQPIGSVSAEGRLAVHVTESADDVDNHWEIVDLSAPETPPFAPERDLSAESFVAGWGPDERFAAYIPVTNPSPDRDTPQVPGIVFADARSGTSTLVEVSQQMSPYYLEGLVWTTRGVLVGTPTEHTTTIDGEVIPPGGFVPGVSNPVIDDGHGGRRIGPDGARLELVPPPMSLYEGGGPDLDQMIVRPGGGQEPLTGIGDPALLADVAWTADGRDMWTITWQREGQQRQFRLGRVATPDGAVSSIQFAAPFRQNPEPSTPFRPAGFSGLAPDDSVMVLNVAGRDGNVLAVPATGATVEVAGAFAGWLRTDWDTGAGGAEP